MNQHQALSGTTRPEARAARPADRPFSSRQALRRQPGAVAAPASERFYYKDDASIDKPFNWGQIRRLLTYLAPYKRTVAIAFLAMAGATAARLAVPYIVRLAIDTAIEPGQAARLTGLVFVLLGAHAINWVASQARIRLTNWVGQRALYDLRTTLFAHIQSLSFRFFDRRPAGSILVRITNDVNSLQDLFTNGIISVIQDGLTLVGIVVIMLGMNARLALLSFIFLPIMIALSTTLRVTIRRAWQLVRVKLARLNAHLNEAIQGIRVTQSFSQETENMSFFAGMNDDNRRSWLRAQYLQAVFNPLVEIVAALATASIYAYGTGLVRADALTIGLLVAFASYLGNFWEPIQRLTQVYSQLLVAMASSERIFEFLDTRPSVAEDERPIDLPRIEGRVTLDGVHFEYEAGRMALRGIDLDVQPGETIALVGHTGAGKTSIINLLCRFYDPTAGRVLVDGIDLRRVSLRSLRSQVGVVLQDTFLFSGTIADNIRFGRPEASEAEVEAAARAVLAHDFIERLPQGYQTEVRERGSRLSMGQRQLISFARALLADPRILILDEATASIDTQTELLIQQALARLLRGRTSFVIAHRLSTIRGADRIIVLDHGRIVEEGNHQSLMAKDGVYAGLIRAQYRFLVEA